MLLFGLFLLWCSCDHTVIESISSENVKMLFFNYSQLIGLICLIQLIDCSSAITRCYTCKSRGPLGDCKDPFYYNSTSIKLTDVEERPCPSGWCAKSVQLKESEALLSTERFCLQRPPSDNEERCSETMLGERGRTQMFMCFCRGDFCNRSIRTTVQSSLFIILIILNYLIHSTKID